MSITPFRRRRRAVTKAVEGRQTVREAAVYVLLVLAFLSLAAIPFAFRGKRGKPPVPTIPPVYHNCSDYSNLLSTAKKNALDNQLIAYQTNNLHHVLVYITPTTGGTPVDTWATLAFNQWGVGRLNHDDGVVLFIFTQDNIRCVRVGIGLKAAISNQEAARIAHDVVKPGVQNGPGTAADAAVQAGVDAILADIAAYEQ